jgi:hypothetical protein
MRTVTMVCVLCGWGLALACGGSGDSSTTAPQRSGSETTNPPGEEKPNNGRGTSAEAVNVVFNEMAAVGSSEWIEIANKGSVPVTLDGYFIADSDKVTGEPKKNNAMQFPTGTVLQPQGRIVIVASKKKGSVGPHAKVECLPDGPESCFYAKFGLSATTGETIHLLAPDTTVVTSTSIPQSLSADAGGSTVESQCRVPDFTGDFAPCAMTPGAPNRAR